MNTSPFRFAALALLLGASLGFSACDDDDDDPAPTPTPTPAATITIAEPLAHQVYRPGDTVRIKGTIVTAAVMHGYNIYIRNHDTNAEVFSFDGHDHGTTATFDQHWVNTFTDSTELDVEVVTLLDHNTGIVAGKRIGIQTAP